MSTNSAFDEFASRLREFMRTAIPAHAEDDDTGSAFSRLALELFGLQFSWNPVFRDFCVARGARPEGLNTWRAIPAMPAAAFKDFMLSCFDPQSALVVFQSSGTTRQRRSRHFHNAKSLAVYEAALAPWFRLHLFPDPESPRGKATPATRWPLAILTPPPAQAPHSSLVYMFDTIRCQLGSPDSVYLGAASKDEGWELNTPAALQWFRRAINGHRPVALLGTAFSFVHLLDVLAGQHLALGLPAGSRALETGGYKGRSRAVPKAELHAAMTSRLGIPAHQIVCEYGMSELSSQAYDSRIGGWTTTTSRPGPAQRRQGTPANARGKSPVPDRVFHFPHWARAQVISSESGLEVTEGETGLLRVFDLANVYSVMAIQTEDLAVRRGTGFELLGRAPQADTRGCSLMAAGHEP